MTETQPERVEAMNGPKRGDLVHVAFDAIYQDMIGGRHVVKITPDPLGVTLVAALPADAEVEILRPPVKVGDVIETVAELNALPYRAAVREQASPWRIWEKSDVDRWRTPGNRSELVSNAVLLPAKVIDLPDGAA